MTRLDGLELQLEQSILSHMMRGNSAFDEADALMKLSKLQFEDERNKFVYNSMEACRKAMYPWDLVWFAYYHHNEIDRFGGCLYLASVYDVRSPYDKCVQQLSSLRCRTHEDMIQITKENPPPESWYEEEFVR